MPYAPREMRLAIFVLVSESIRQPLVDSNVGSNAETPGEVF
jgi:hypothetical protein